MQAANGSAVQHEVSASRAKSERKEKCLNFIFVFQKKVPTEKDKSIVLSLKTAFGTKNFQNHCQ